MNNMGLTLLEEMLNCITDIKQHLSVFYEPVLNSEKNIDQIASELKGQYNDIYKAYIDMIKLRISR